MRGWEVRGVGNGCHTLTCPLSLQLTFGRLGQVVEDKKPITLKDISEVGTSCVPPTPGDMGVTPVSHGASWGAQACWFQPHPASPCRRSTSS